MSLGVILKKGVKQSNDINESENMQITQSSNQNRPHIGAVAIISRIFCRCLQKVTCAIHMSPVILHHQSVQNQCSFLFLQLIIKASYDIFALLENRKRD